MQRDERAAWNGVRKSHLTGVFKLSLADGLIYGLLCNSQGHRERLCHGVLWNRKIKKKKRTKLPWTTTKCAFSSGKSSLNSFVHWHVSRFESLCRRLRTQCYIFKIIEFMFHGWGQALWDFLNIASDEKTLESFHARGTSGEQRAYLQFVCRRLNRSHRRCLHCRHSPHRHCPLCGGTHTVSDAVMSTGSH